MSDKNQGLNDRLERKKRVQRIKTGMLWLLITWMLALMLISVTLIAKVHSLQEQIDIITENTIRSQQVDQKENHAPNDSGSAKVQKYDAADSAEAQTEQVLSANALHTEQTGASVKSADADTETEIKKRKDSRKSEDIRRVYLTFDDGPSKNTEKILDILDRYQVKATFFVTGREDKESLNMYREIVKRGHTIGMHSYSHQYDAIYESAEAFEADLMKIKKRIYDASGQDCRLYRFPGGSSNQVSSTDMKELIGVLKKKDITYFDWNVECGDASNHSYTAKELVDNVMKDVVKYHTSVVLLHDASNKTATVEALENIIKKLQKMDAQLLPIDEKTTLVQHVSAESVED